MSPCVSGVWCRAYEATADELQSDDLLLYPESTHPCRGAPRVFLNKPKASRVLT